MANFFERALDKLLPERVVALQENAKLLTDARGIINAQGYELDRMQESMSELSLYLEDLDWVPITGWQDFAGFKLETVKEQSDRCRALLSVNPTIKKAVNARVGYIWGRGVQFSGNGITRFVDDARNQQLIFDDSAHWPLEAQLATDGNIWFAKNTQNGDLINVPINHVAGWVLDKNDPTRVLYWLRSYTLLEKNFSTGIDEPKVINVFYPADDNTYPLVSSIDGIKVDKNMRMVHLAANRQEGWILGLPDIMAAMFWAKAHKELFESGTTYVKAQGKFAAKVVSNTRGGAANAAARIAETPRRDPLSGEVMDTGGTAVMSGGLDYQLMGKMTGGVDFDNFDPVAGLVAAGLGIPLRVLLGDAETPDTSLEQSVVNEMQMRQKLWTSFFKRLFGVERKVTVSWPKIRTEPEYRRIQSVEISNKTGVLSGEELRQLTLEAYDLNGDPKKLPDIEKNPYILQQKAIADHQAKIAEKAAEKAAASVPEQGVDAGIGKLSTGDDAKASRNDQTDTNTKNE